MKTFQVDKQKYIEGQDTWRKFTTMAGAEEYRNKELPNWFQVVISPREERGKLIYKVVCNLKEVN